MYENENYANGYINSQAGMNQDTSQNGTQMGNQSDAQTAAMGAQQNGYYQMSQNIPPVYGTEQAKAPKVKKAKAAKKKGGVRRFFGKTVACAALGLCFGLFAGGGLYVIDQTTGLFDNLQSTEATLSDSDLAELRQWMSSVNTDSTGVVNTSNITAITSDVSSVVENVMPAMVSIMNSYTQRTSYFGQVIEQEAGSTGSGIIVGENDTELLIATNYHVIESAEELTVHFIDDTDADAVVKGTNEDMDLAVIAVSLSDLSEETKSAITIAKLGNSDDLKLGEPVIAIGNALGYGQSVTGGWVSALNREVTLSDGSTGTFIQTDAAINPGNSGGALLNMNGEVIGINSNKIGGTVIEGIGYAIPISAAQPILEDLMSKVTRTKVTDGESGYLGIVPQSVTSDIASLYGMPEGVFVSRVDDGTPAANAGILKGDIITEFDGESLSTAEELRERLEYYHEGETVTVTVMRNKNGEYSELELEITLGSRDSAS